VVVAVTVGLQNKYMQVKNRHFGQFEWKQFFTRIIYFIGKTIVESFCGP